MRQTTIAFINAAERRFERCTSACELTSFPYGFHELCGRSFTGTDASHNHCRVPALRRPTKTCIFSVALFTRNKIYAAPTVRSFVRFRVSRVAYSRGTTCSGPGLCRRPFLRLLPTIPRFKRIPDETKRDGIQMKISNRTPRAAS